MSRSEHGRDQTGGEAGICQVCGGTIVLDGREVGSERYPFRKICRTCGAEYGTTATATRNY